MTADGKPAPGARDENQRMFIRTLRSRKALAIFPGMSLVRLSLLALATCLVWTGCPPNDRKVDEEKEMWYMRGESRKNSMDYKGAVEAFLKALETNPHSAAAHKKLGILYDREEEVRDYAAAIYHYQRLLALRPDDQHANIIRDAVQNCKQELAGEVGQIPVDDVTAKILEERDALSQEVVNLRAENQKLREALTRAGGGQGGVNLPELNRPAGGAGGDSRRRTTDVAPPRPPEPPREPRSTEPEPRPAGRPTTHVVQKGENLYRIGLRYGVSPARLQQANPRVNARTMKEGTILRIPPER